MHQGSFALDPSLVERIHRRRARRQLLGNGVLWVGLFGGLGAALGLAIAGVLAGAVVVSLGGLAFAGILAWSSRPAVTVPGLLAQEHERGGGVGGGTVLKIDAGGITLMRAGEVLEARPGALELVDCGAWRELRPRAWPVVWAWVPADHAIVPALETALAAGAAGGAWPSYPPREPGWGATEGTLGPAARRALRSAAGGQAVWWGGVVFFGVVALAAAGGVLVLGAGLHGLGVVGTALGLAAFMSMNAWMPAIWERVRRRPVPSAQHVFGPSGVCSLGPGLRTFSPWRAMHQMQRHGGVLLLEGPRGWVVVDPAQGGDPEAVAAAFAQSRGEPPLEHPPRPSPPRRDDGSPYRPPRAAVGLDRRSTVSESEPD